jgi:N-acetyl-gamma-glutamyl-phosphate reductase
MTKAKVGILGATGYTGSELIRLLVKHPGILLKAITSESHTGKKISDVHPHLAKVCDKKLISLDKIKEHDLDLIFLALPHGKSMEIVDNIFNNGIKNTKTKIIDLSGDFRLSNGAEYSKWYNMPHKCPELIKHAVYGLPEIFRDKIKTSNFVANPGCYPTSAILAIAPILKYDLIEHDNIIIDSKSGISGAGAKIKQTTHFPTVNEDFTAYAIGTHRHTPEIEKILTSIYWTSVRVNFTPHLVPINRGILTTIYCKAKEKIDQRDFNDAFSKTYTKEPFIRIRNSPPSVQSVRGSNLCDVYVKFNPRTNDVITISAIDNLVKGAAGQAVQNMNLMLGLSEIIGINSPPIAP